MSGGTGGAGANRSGPGWERKPALDGLRGVALALVLVFHGGVGLVGGAIGVDLFLVLSGYLITGLLLVEHDRSGRVDLPAFWGRRIRRLVPAAVALVGVVALFGGVALLDGAAALGWWSNWRFALADQGYFDAFGSPSPLRHTWSLAVEEQWYLLWPGLCWLLVARWRGRLLLPGVLLLAAGSAAAMALVAGDLDRAHMGTDTRAQGLLVGAAVAVGLHGRRLPGRRPSTVAGLAGAVVVGAMALRTSGTEPWLYRGGHLLVAAAGAALVVAAIAPGGPIAAVLGWGPLRAVGRLSYGAYLWHWPLYLWLTPDRTGLDRWPLLGVRLAATAAAAILSWRLVERPVLEDRPLPRPRVALPAAVATLLVVVVATAAVDPVAHPRTVSVAAAEPTLPAGYRRPSAPPRPQPTILDRAPLARPRQGDPAVTVVGDSTGWALGWAVEPVDGVEVSDGAGIGCGLHPSAVLIDGVPRVETGLPVRCTEIADFWRWSVTAYDPDVVLLTLGAWEVYDRELAGGSRLEVGTRTWRRWIAGLLERIGADLATAAPHAVLAVAEVPCYHERDLALGGPDSPRNDPARRQAVDDLIDEFVARHPARVVSVPWSAWLCGPDPPARPDGVHLTRESARGLWAGPLGEWIRQLDWVRQGAPSSTS